MKFLTLSLLLLLFTSAYAQNKDTTRTQRYPRRIVVGGGLDMSYVGDFAGIGIDLYAQFRLNENKQLVGIGFEYIYGLNEKQYPGQSVSFFTNDTTDISIGARLITVPYRLEFNQYLIDPNFNRLTARVGVKVGPSLQFVDTDYFSFDKQISGVTPSNFVKLGFLTGATLNFEYFYKHLSLTLELCANYHYINKAITIVDSPHQLGASVKMGVAFSFGPVGRLKTK
jgi:hypothetical protein